MCITEGVLNIVELWMIATFHMKINVAAHTRWAQWEEAGSYTNIRWYANGRSW